MKEFSVVALLCCCLACKGVAQQACPIEVRQTNSNKLVSSDEDPWNSALHIEYVNHGRISTVAVKFGVYFVNKLGEGEDSVYYYVDNDGVKPEKLRKSDWSDGVYTKGNSSLKALAWVERASFADGTVWQDDGSRSCGLLNQLPHPRAYQATPSAGLTEEQKAAIKSNSEAARTSPASAAALAIDGHQNSPEELAELVKQGKASRCAVITDPPGAEVFVDGNKAGVAPFVFVLLKRESPRTITIKMPGYKTVERQFVPDGKVIPIGLKLEKESNSN